MAALRTRVKAAITSDLNTTRVSAWIWRAFFFVMALAISGIVGAQLWNNDSSGGLGAKIYNEKCAGCHVNMGRGAPDLFPPLAGDPVVTATDPLDHIRTVLFGKSGTTIGGVTYAVTMPSWAGQLSDEEVAAVINYERTNWGNGAPTVTAAAVEKIRNEGP
jgi:mono/diheme cytochrome c family protein